MARPTDLPRWEPPGSAIAEPPEAKKDAGWGPTGEKPPFNFFNWFWNLVYLWLQHFDEDLPRQFDTLKDFIDEDLPVGRTGMVIGRQDQAWTESWTVAHLDPGTYDGGVVDLVATGQRVYASVFSLSGAPQVNKIYAHDPVTGAELWNVDVTNSGLASQMATDGQQLFFTDDALSIKVLDRDGGTLATMNLAGAGFISAMITDGVRLYVAREDPGTSVTIEAYDAQTHSTTVLWTWNGAINITVNDLATDGDRVFLAQQYDGGGGDVVKALQASDGLELFGVNLDSTDANAITTDGEYLYVCTENGVLVTPRYTGDPGENVLKNTQVSQDIAVSPRYMATALEPGSTQSAFRVARKRSLITADQQLWHSAAQSNPSRAVALDTRYAFFGGFRESLSGNNNTLVAIYLPSTPADYRQSANTDATRQYHNLVVVPETT